MDKDRYQQNPFMYVIGLISLLLSMVLLCLSVYVLPYLLFGWVYDIPSYIIEWQGYLERIYGMSETLSGWLISSVFLLPGVLAAYIAYFTSNQIDDIYHGIESKNKAKGEILKREIKDTTNILSKIIIIVILVVIVTEFIEWLLYIPPPQS